MAKKGLNICKKIFYNPLFVSLLLTSIIIIIIVAIYKIQTFGAGMLFKCGFYIFIMLTIIIYVHDFLITRELKSNNINKEVKDVFSGIDLSKEISHDVIQVDPIIYEKDNFSDSNKSDESSNLSYKKTHDRFNKILGTLNTNKEDANVEDANVEHTNVEHTNVQGGDANVNANVNTDVNANMDVNNILSSIVDVSVNST